MADANKITLEESESKGRYTYTEPGKPAAELTFSKLGSVSIIIDHTGVPDAYRGQGIGKMLVERAVNDMRAQDKTIIPLCPFAAALFRRYPDWSDVLRT